jgi:glycosyltransferase involved in cell wall biosynthesis
MNAELVSILIPTFNEEKFIVNTLESVYRFELPINVSIEVIIIDGFSSDNTINLVQNFKGNRNIKIIYNEHKFQNFALNLGIKNSNGNWILRLDAHTLYPTDYLYKSYVTAINTSAANTGGIIITLPGNDSFQACLIQALTTHSFGVGDSTFRSGAANGPVDTVPFGFFPKKLFDEIGYYNDKLVRGEDYEFNSRIRKFGKIVWMNSEIVSSYFNQSKINLFLKKQLLLEGPYNAIMWYLAPYTFALRHIIPFFFFSGVILGFCFSFVSVYLKYMYFGVLILYFFIAIFSSIQQVIRYKDYKLFLTLPPLFFAFHFVYGCGVFIGFIKILVSKFRGIDL